MSSVSNLTSTDGPEWDSSANHGPIVSVISWLLVVAAFLVTATRLGTRFAVVRQIRPDDVTIVAALVGTPTALIVRKLRSLILSDVCDWPNDCRIPRSCQWPRAR